MKFRHFVTAAAVMLSIAAVAQPQAKPAEKEEAVTELPSRIHAGRQCYSGRHPAAPAVVSGTP